MRLAVLSDIHSNIIGLKLALEDIKKENINSILYLGDYITDGDDNNEVIDIVKKTATHAILGNREIYMINYDSSKKKFNNYKPIAYAYESLNSDSINYIKSLKENVIIKINNYKILMIHGNSYINDNKIMFERIINDFDFDICLYGHSHAYSYEKYKGKLFINPGSIGQPIDGKFYKYCILDISDEIHITLKKFKISETFDEFRKNYLNSNYYKKNKIWANLVYLGIRDGKDYCSSFIKQYSSKIKESENNVNECNRIWNETYKEYSKDI